MTYRNNARRFRKAVALTALTIAVAPGCASMKNPFAKSPLADQPNFASTTSKTASGISGQFKSMGTAVSSAMGKAKNAVTSSFATKSDVNDETSLANMPSSLGPEMWVADGQYHEARRDHAKALDKYTKALELEPNNLPALLSTARLYAKQGQSTESVEFYNRAIAVNPDASYYNEIANVHQRVGNTSGAQAAVQKAIERDPTNIKYRNNLATLLVAGGRSDEAVSQLQQVFPPAIANYNVAFLHYQNGNTAGAQQHLQMAVQADPNCQPARDLIAAMTTSQGAQTAMSAYNSAGEIFRTAQAATTPQTTATQVPYTQPQSVQTQSSQPQNAVPASQANYSVGGSQPILP